MADITISQLPEALELFSSDVVDVVQQGGNRKATLDTMANFFNGKNIIVSNDAPPESCTTTDLQNYNKSKIYVYKKLAGDKVYILENIEESQTTQNTWNLTWQELNGGGDIPGEYVTQLELQAHNTSSEAHEDIREVINVLLHNVKIEDYPDIQKIVRQGLAKEVFQVGEQFVIDESKGIVMTILGFDQDEPTNPQYTHSMTVQTTGLVYPRIPFSVAQATWYIDEDSYPNGLSAGQYHFYLASGIAPAYGGEKNYTFTLTSPVPVGGQVCIDISSYTDSFVSSTVYTFASSSATTAIEDGVVISEGTDGTELPSLYENVATANTNCITRIVEGNNRWKTSYARLYLNSTGYNWWTPQTVFDRNPGGGVSGYLSTFTGTNFLSIVGPVNKNTQKTVVDGYGMDTTQDTFFLLSRPEVYGGTERNTDGADGVVYEYYDSGRSDLYSPGTGADSNRIKYTNNVALTQWLRTPNAETGNQVRTIGTTGSITQVPSNNRYVRFAPACVIW